MKQQNKQSGFTIIEVVLVLAIAGLIFLVVFLALPQLQRSRRDSARRDLVGRTIASLEQYAANNNGNYPADAAAFATFASAGNYFGPCTSAAAATLECESFSDPEKGAIAVTTAEGQVPAIAETTGSMLYSRSATCSGAGTLAVGGGTRQVAVAIALEQGVGFCQDNSD